MKKFYVVLFVVLVLVLFGIGTKIIIDKQYDDKVNSIFNKKIMQIEVIHRLNTITRKSLTIGNKNDITKFVQNLRINNWKPKYLDVNTYLFRYTVIINNHTSIDFTEAKSYICRIDDKFYYIPKNVYLYLESLK